ncbi:hypothetical protein [Thalassotalea hakodatensis]|uniref:hypothetical protein n=1 Tax=Thalassotalea hakodatensis TaxID=3030492 RepID=UPI0025723254|nr:hypothetical protein [Thalassotalea hakodatensis]
MQHEQWQALLNNGNECFYDRRWLQAEFYYKEAYELLADNYQNNPYETDILLAWICACHNLSALFEVQGDLDVSLRYLLVPHEYLQALSDDSVRDEDVKLIAIKALNITLQRLLSFSKKYPICEDCVNKLKALKVRLAQNEEVLH